ncbi:MAG: DUF3109 family protein [Ignavibacteria bacterium]|nr:DUF3109 family protein [Ignavibacteria bacterium]
MSFLENVFFNTCDLNSPFLCDVNVCKGICCYIEGELGAPLKEYEIPIINKLLPILLDYLPQKSKNIIEKEGCVKKNSNKYFTNVVDKRECVFALFENGIARCSFEKAYFEKRTNFRKPISCHLFPLREYSFGFTDLIYLKLPECQAAIRKGTEEKVSLLESSRESLIRRFGNDWYTKLTLICQKSKNTDKFNINCGG